MRNEAGSRLPKKGKNLHAIDVNGGGEARYARMIAQALRRDFGQARGAVKIVMQWTGASERTVKHWFAGTSGPSGPHLVALMRYSNAVLNGLLVLSGRDRTIRNLRLSEARGKLKELRELFDGFADGTR